MTALPEMHYRCDRCPTEEIVPLANTPGGTRAAGPSGWLVLTIGADPSTPPKHLCPNCRSQFAYFMGNHHS